jgi:hypothetical protein
LHAQGAAINAYDPINDRMVLCKCSRQAREGDAARHSGRLPYLLTVQERP